MWTCHEVMKSLRDLGSLHGQVDIKTAKSRQVDSQMPL